MALDVRVAAAKVISEVLGGKSLNQALGPLLDNVAERDRALLQQLCYGTLRQQPRLSALLAQLLDKPLRDKDRDIQALLLCGLYQLGDMRIPDHAAVDATVNATRVLKKKWASGMSNAVLRRFLRERQVLEQGLSEAAAASHPQWLYEAIRQQWPGPADAIILCNNQQPPMTLRVNQLQVATGDYAAALAENGIGFRPGELSPQALSLEQPMDVMAVPGFAEGQVSVQDEAAQMAALLLQAHPGERILDACAAPGGKACHILENQPQLAELVAMDIDERRLLKVSENLARLNLKATLMCGDGATPPAQLEAASFDRILVDAPCSATGVIRRHPDVKILRRDSDIEQLHTQQLQILHGLWPLLKPRGTLLYVTCSIMQQENSAVIEQFLAQQSQAQLDLLDAPWGIAMPAGRQLLPSVDGTDGMFFARLRKHS